MAGGATAWAGPVRDAGKEAFLPPVDEGRATTALLDLGAYFKNPHAAASARPDGSGTALFKYHGVLADSMNGDRLRFLADGVFLTDREKPPSINPVSLDYLLGVSSRLDHLRIQFDREESWAIRGNGDYSNWDVRGSLLFGARAAGEPSVAAESSGPPDRLSAAVTLGYFLHNHTTPARLDGTGLAGWRYDGAVEASLFGGRLLLRGDADALTDRTRRRMNPADLDLDLGVGTSYQGWEILVSRRTREALDRSGHALYYLFSLRRRIDSRTFLDEM